MIEVKSKEEFSQILLTKEKVVVDFWAPSCGPCKMLSPRIDTISKKNEEITFIKVNVEECEDIAKDYKISSIPVVLSIKNGVEGPKLMGMITEKALQDLVDVYLK